MDGDQQVGSRRLHVAVGSSGEKGEGCLFREERQCGSGRRRQALQKQRTEQGAVVRLVTQLRPHPHQELGGLLVTQLGVAEKSGQASGAGLGQPTA